MVASSSGLLSLAGVRFFRIDLLVCPSPHLWWPDNWKSWNQLFHIAGHHLVYSHGGGKISGNEKGQVLMNRSFSSLCFYQVCECPIGQSKSHSQAQIQGVEKYCPSLGERSSKLTLQRCIHTRMGEIRGYFLQSTIVDKSSHFPTFLTALALWVFLIFANPKRIKQDLIIVSIFICISLILSKLVHLFIQLLAQHSCFKITCTHIHEKRLEVYILV